MPESAEDRPVPPRPRDLRATGRRTWAEVVDGFDLNPVELARLREHCRTEDELDLMRAAVRADQVTVEGSAGQPRANPLFDEIRKHRMLLVQLGEGLALPVGDEDVGQTPAQKRAHRAAQQRWRDRQAAKAVRGAGHGAA